MGTSIRATAIRVVRPEFGRRITALAAAITTLAALLSGLPNTAAAGFQANVNGVNWSGYAAVGAGYRSVAATWSVPTVTCSSPRQVVGAWVGLGGIASDAVEQTGVEARCSTGRPGYRAWAELAPAPPVYYRDRVAPGDVLSAQVRRFRTSYTLTVIDRSRHWTETMTAPGVGDDASAEVIVESPTGSFPGFDRFSFTGATVDGRNLSAVRPAALDAANGARFQDHTTPLNGTAFTVTSRSATG